MNVPAIRERLDWVGSCLSAVCAVHCTLKPLLLVLPSVIWGNLWSPHVESILLTSGVLLALCSVLWGYSHHENELIFLPIAVALALTVAGQLPAGHGWREQVFVVPGGVLIALTHWINIRFCHNCEN
ncbi:MAG: MerC domain-containing protein [bacterium]